MQLVTLSHTVEQSTGYILHPPTTSDELAPVVGLSLLLFFFLSLLVKLLFLLSMNYIHSSDECRICSCGQFSVVDAVVVVVFGGV